MGAGRNSSSLPFIQQTLLQPDTVGSVALASSGGGGTPAWVASESSANARPGNSSGSREPRGLWGPRIPRVCLPSHSAPYPGHPTPSHQERADGSPLPTPPNLPDAHRRGRPPWALNLTPRKVPIVHLQSCFKVTLISKLLAALAGDYSCINQGEIMPVTD